ncbi:hypothetical protein SLEP1_g6662 [Rubroshorea leprosula]|uniref:SCP domain-containing protein n=1 Tax=Rubroshorea leprosula TaxID=152421 RepID=A0AAV5HVY2_9ROSI|nr:hypothetical protein SLEP1_g6662 [Rubroshorea leprosula]
MRSMMKALACLLALALVIRLFHAQDSPQDYLSAQNTARAAVGVAPMTWNTTVATYAQNYLNQHIGDCKMVHSGGPYGGEPGMGQC